MTITWDKCARQAVWVGRIGTDTFEQREKFILARCKRPGDSARRRRHNRPKREWHWSYCVTIRRGTVCYRLGIFDTHADAKQAALNALTSE